MKRLQAIVTGRVQGVYYRDYVRHQARQLNLTGWAHNRDDGSVEVVAEGEDAALEQLAMRLRQGPLRSRVEQVQVTYGTPLGEMNAFTIG